MVKKKAEIIKDRRIGDKDGNKNETSLNSSCKLTYVHPRQ